ncbi:hypothetical protein RhiJN_20553 [Ceratobasidium sp. AG-Ba]|nr:hypothetical protein RhiJN_05731 [Ceratobasidium sp. AG-Ba]QRV92535.1 hypothetical protein RhiJN_20553 [Ceratobasidium sp. AG-Ba]QRW06661.1 hypothetical protein RhiLY_05660 [Ceratobasidium sp. AG-Ba]
MLPAQRKKVDMSTMTEEEKKLFRLYGKLPTHKNVLTKVQKDRKYFDSGDYALSKAGVTPQTAVGTAIPHPENIPHVTPSPHPNVHAPLSTSPTGQIGSPIKELASESNPPSAKEDVPIIAAPVPTAAAPAPAPE